MCVCVTCRLTAKNRDQLRNHMLGNRVWATFTFNVDIASCLFVYVRARMRAFVKDEAAECVFTGSTNGTDGQ